MCFIVLTSCGKLESSLSTTLFTASNRKLIMAKRTPKEAKSSQSNLQVSASTAKSLAYFLLEKGFEEADIKAITKQELSQIESPDARLPLEAYQALWNEAIKFTGQDDLGLYLGTHPNDENMGLLGHIFFNNATLEKALRQYERFYKIINEGMHVELAMDEHLVRIQYLCDESGVYCIPDMERTLSVSVYRARQYISPQLRIEHVAFQHSAPPYLNSYKAAFPCPVRFDEPHCEIVFQRRFLDYRLPHRSSYLHKLLTRHIESMLKRIAPKPSFKDRVKRAISKRMAKDSIDAEHIADALCMSRNTLYRRLKNEDVSFHDLVDEVRHAKAKKYLAAGKHSLSEIAFLLGFSELSAFSRAFKRWTGHSPANYMKQSSNKDNE